MKNTLKTPPAIEPVSLSEMRLQLGISDADDTTRNPVISSSITAAREWAEEITRIAFITQSWTLNTDCFQPYFDLKANLQSIVSVKYIDTDGIQQTLDPADYLVDDKSSRLYPAYSTAWPAVRVQPNSIEIEYISGYANAEAVPENIKMAIKFIVGHWENYQGSIEGSRIGTIPYAVTQLLGSHKDMRNIF